MKLLLFCALCTMPTAALLFSEQGAKHDAGAVMSQLSGIMAGAQQKLAFAQRHHAKVVKKVRNEAAAFLEDEAKVYGNYISGYATELTQAEAGVQHATQSAKAALAAAEAAPSSPGDWRDPDAEKRAKLGAKASSAERGIKRAERRRERQVREAEERGEETLEDEAQKLGMKVGDMTPLVDKAKQSLEATAEKKMVPVASGGGAAGSNVSAKANLTALEDNLGKATSKSQADTTAANKRLDGFLSKTGKDVATKVAKLQESLDVAQRNEISKVLGRSKATAAAKPALPKLAKVKAAPAAKAEPAAKPTVKAAAASAKAPVKAAAAKK